MPTERTVHEVLDRASILAKRGWISGDWYSADGKKLCMLQCVMSVLGINGRQNPMGLPVPYLRAIDNVLSEHRRYRIHRVRIAVRHRKPRQHPTVIRHAIIAWNDDADRKQIQVVKVLRLAAKRSERKWWRYHNHLLAVNQTVVDTADVLANI